jgi:hypothetical protein
MMWWRWMREGTNTVLVVGDGGKLPRRLRPA